MIELSPVIEIAAVLGGYVVKAVTYEDGGDEATVQHHIVSRIEDAFPFVRRCLESVDALPSRDHERIESKLNG